MPDTRTTEQDICWDLHHVITKMAAVAQKLAIAGYSTAADDIVPRPRVGNGPWNAWPTGKCRRSTMG